MNENNDDVTAEDESIAIILTPLEVVIGALIMIGLGMAIAIGAMLASAS